MHKVTKRVISFDDEQETHQERLLKCKLAKCIQVKLFVPHWVLEREIQSFMEVRSTNLGISISRELRENAYEFFWNGASAFLDFSELNCDVGIAGASFVLCNEALGIETDYYKHI